MSSPEQQEGGQSVQGDYGAAGFDWSVLQVPTARAMVLGQLEFSWAELRDRLAGSRRWSSPGSPAPAP